MAVGRRVVFMYLLAVWCFADTLGVRAPLPSSVQSHSAEPAVSSGDRVMGALQQAVTSPEHHNHQDLSSPTGRRMKDEDDERWEECRKEGSERGSSSGGGGHDLVAMDMKESEGTSSADVAADCPVCLDQMQAEAGAGEALPVSSWNGCGHRFHTACIQNLKLCPLCRRSPAGTPALGVVLPDSTHSLVFPDGPHARHHSQSLIVRLGIRDSTMLGMTFGGAMVGFMFLLAILLANWLERTWN